MFDAWEEIIGTGLAITWVFVLPVLGLWKMIDIIVWLANHVRIGVAT